MADYSEHMMIVEASVLGGSDDLHPDDTNVFGECIVAGMYGIKLRACDEAGIDPVERALKIFGEGECLAREEDFLIAVREATPEEIRVDAGGATKFHEHYLNMYIGEYTVAIPSPMPGV
jgi:hypothetical protein